MKFNFKKVAAVTASMLATVGLTAGVASAISYPDNWSSSNVAVVYGNNIDSAVASNINQDIEESISFESGSTGVSEESVQLKRSSDEYNLGENMTDFYDSLDSEELGEILADGEYLNDDNDDFAYEQNFALSSNAQMTHFRDRDYEDYEPTVGFHFTKGDLLGNYTLEFTPDAAEGKTEFAKLKNTYLTILGKEYYISDAATDGSELTLLDSANDATLKEGESTSVVVGDKTYEVELSFISTGQVKLTVNGEETNTLADGDTYKLSDDSYVSIQDLLVQDYEGGTKQVTFSIGNGKVSLFNDGSEVEINGDAVSQIDEYDGYKLNSYITNSSTDIETISLEWLADDDMFLTAENDLEMPALGDIKFTMDELEAPSEEKTTFGTGDPFSVTTNVEDGEASIDLFYLNDAEDGFATANLGASSAQHLITNETGGDTSTVNLNLENETYFVASWKSGREAETYVYELSNIKDNSGKNETTIENLADGSTQVFKEIDDDNDVGRLRMTLTDANESGETASIKVEPISGGSVYTDRVFTAEGLQFRLPWINSTGGSANMSTPLTASAACDSVLRDGEFYTGTLTYNTSVDNSSTTTTCVDSWDMNFTEEDVDGNIAAGSSFQTTVSVDSDDGIEADGLSPDFTKQIGRTGDNYVGYKESKLATKIDWEQVSSGLDAMEITYAGEESFADVYVSSTTEAGSSGDAGTKAISADEAYSDNDVVIAVGGSCINAAAAEALGVSEETCGSDFTDATGVGSGEFLIQKVSDAYDGETTAIVVAGYEAGDTETAGNKFLEADTELSEEGTVYETATKEVVSAQ